MAKLTKLLFSILAIALLYVALRGMDWRAFALSLAGLHYGWAAACLLFESAALLLRAYRWDLLLAYRAGPRLLIAFVGEAVGDVGNTFLPARAGEAMRAVLVARRLETGVPFVVGTITSERVGDAVFVSLLAFTMVLLVPHVPGWLIACALLFGPLGIVVFVVIAYLPAFHRLVFPLLERSLLLRPVVTRMERIFDDVWEGSRALFGHPGRTGAYLALTVGYWVIDGVAVVCLTWAIGAPLPLPKALLFLSALGLSSAVPSTPGYVGIFQFVAVSVLVPLGMARVDALATVLIYQLSMLLLQLTVAGLGWLLLVPRGSTADQ